MNEKMLALLKIRYPAGCIIELTGEMHDDPRPIEVGTRGKVVYIDDFGTIHMAWENGRTLGLIPGKDEFRKVIAPAGRDVRCRVFTAPEFRRLMDEIYQDKAQKICLDFSADGLYIGLGEDDIPAEDLHDRLAIAIGADEVTSIHIDDCEPTGVWVAYK